MFLHVRCIIICHVLNLTFLKDAAVHGVISRPLQHPRDLAFSKSSVTGALGIMSISYLFTRLENRVAG